MKLHNTPPAGKITWPVPKNQDEAGNIFLAGLAKTKGRGEHSLLLTRHCDPDPVGRSAASRHPAYPILDTNERDNPNHQISL